MKNLFKKTEFSVSGHSGLATESITYFTSDQESFVDDDEVTQDDVIKADNYTLGYWKFAKLGKITEDEIEILCKFGILPITSMDIVC